MKTILSLMFMMMMLLGGLSQAYATSYDEATWENIRIDGNFGPSDCGE